MISLDNSLKVNDEVEEVKAEVLGMDRILMIYLENLMV